MSAHFSLRISLLDKQVVDCDRLPLGRVDDIELEVAAGGDRPHVTALLTGGQALGERLGGLTGRWIAGLSSRLRKRGPGPARIDVALIEDVDPMVTLSIAADDLPDVAGLERWLGHHVVQRIPGAGDALE